MKRKVLSLLIVMAMGMTLLVGCGGSADKDVDNNKESSVNQEENLVEGKEEENIDTAVLTDIWTGKKVEISYNKDNCENLSADEYLLSVSVDTGEAFDIEFHADYTASSFYNEEIQAMASVGLKASDLSDYSTAEIKVYGYEFYDSASDGLYSCTLLNEVDGGVLIVHNLDFGFSNEDIANAYAEKIFVSAKMFTGDSEDSETDANTEESGNKLAVTNEEKELVYKADYEAIKDKIVKEEKDRNEASYYDANGLEIMYVYYDGENITDVFFTEYSDSGVKKYRKVYAFQENGEYGMMEFEYHENGEAKTETVYNDDGCKMVFYFDENGDYVSGTEYDKDGNVIE